MTEADMISRAAIIAEGVSWLGTPYHHQASCKGVGCDCLGLLRGVYRFVYGREAAPVPAYSQNWFEAGGEEDLAAAAARHLMPVAAGDARGGDAVVFRLRPGAPAKHCALLITPDRFIHAVSGRSVAEADFSHWWRRHAVGFFAFPGVCD